MIIADHKSLGIAWEINDRRKRKKVKYAPGLWGRKCASAKSLDRSLSKIKG
jgi:hypothetical protein